MSYEMFTLEQVVHDFSLGFQKAPLFNAVSPVAMSSAYAKVVEKGLQIALPSGSEKVRNELLVMPILLEVQDMSDGLISIHSGVRLNVDKDKGLVGECDFILCLSHITEFVDAPVVCVVEAKKQDIESGLGQCAAQMVAASMFNQRKGSAITTVYGCVTTGGLWYFLLLQEQQLVLDSREYFIRAVDELLGMFRCILDDVQRSA